MLHVSESRRGEHGLSYLSDDDLLSLLVDGVSDHIWYGVPTQIQLKQRAFTQMSIASELIGI